MFFIELTLLALIALLIAYQVTTAWWKRSLNGWLIQISVKYGLKAIQKDFFHKKLLAYDRKRAVLVYLDVDDGEENGHMIGMAEILSCELLVHEKNTNAWQHNIDSISLELTLKTGNKVVSIPLYTDSLLARFSKKRLQLTAIRWYEQINDRITVEEESLSHIA